MTTSRATTPDSHGLRTSDSGLPEHRVERTGVPWRLGATGLFLVALWAVLMTGVDVAHADAGAPPQGEVISAPPAHPSAIPPKTVPSSELSIPDVTPESSPGADGPSLPHVPVDPELYESAIVVGDSDTALASTASPPTAPSSSAPSPAEPPPTPTQTSGSFSEAAPGAPAAVAEAIDMGSDGVEPSGTAAPKTESLDTSSPSTASPDIATGDLARSPAAHPAQNNGLAAPPRGEETTAPARGVATGPASLVTDSAGTPSSIVAATSMGHDVSSTAPALCDSERSDVGTGGMARPRSAARTQSTLSESAAATTAADADGSGTRIGGPAALTRSQGIPLHTPVAPPPPPPPAVPVGPSSASASSGSTCGPGHNDQQGMSLLALGADFSAPLLGGSLHPGSGFVMPVLGGARDPGARPD